MSGIHRPEEQVDAGESEMGPGVDLTISLLALVLLVLMVVVGDYEALSAGKYGPEQQWIPASLLEAERNQARSGQAASRRQIEELRSDLEAIANALELSRKESQEKNIRIDDLDQKLNAALATKVVQLQQYRSEFFGKLRAVLAGRPGVQIVGDRFVFQSEVLFPVGSTDLTQAGVAQMTALAITIKDIAVEIPGDLKWILRVDGHTDPQPVKGGQFASNWELSAARAITVVKLLIADGVPPERLAATGFGEYQPIVSGDTPDAYAKDRRIELQLTSR